VLCVVAAVTYAIGVLAQKPVVRRLPPLQVTFLACVIGAVACLPFAPGLVRDVATAPPTATGWLIYLGLVPTALAFSTWAYALARMDAGRLGVSTYAVPPVTIALGAALLGETPPLLAIVGGGICLVGVGLSDAGSESSPGPSPSTGPERQEDVHPFVRPTRARAEALVKDIALYHMSDLPISCKNVRVTPPRHLSSAYLAILAVRSGPTYDDQLSCSGTVAVRDSGLSSTPALGVRFARG
jgi:uncharacterized membrane protein